MSIIKVISHRFFRLYAVLGGLWLSAGVALAQGSMFDKIKSGAKSSIDRAYAGPTGTVKEMTFIEAMSTAINIVLTLIGIVFFGLLLYAGWLWMTARGDSGQIDRAKQITREVVIGLLIVFLARLISEFIFRQIGGAVDQAV